MPRGAPSRHVPCPLPDARWPVHYLLQIELQRRKSPALHLQAKPDLSQTSAEIAKETTKATER
eukprot:6023586-Amphidinium_carterae.1